MKKLSIVLAGWLLLSGCCYKMLCVGDSFAEVRFYGFDFHDLDTVYFEAYDGADTLSRYQWFNKQEQKDGYILIPFLSDALMTPYNPASCRVSVPKTGQVFDITGFQYKDDHCKSGMCKQDFQSLESYSVNGQPQQLQDHALVLTH